MAVGRVRRTAALGLVVLLAVAVERRAVHAAMDSSDASEGITAFLEKRPPRFNQGDPPD